MKRILKRGLGDCNQQEWATFWRYPTEKKIPFPLVRPPSRGTPQRAPDYTDTSRLHIAISRWESCAYTLPCHLRKSQRRRGEKVSFCFWSACSARIWAASETRRRQCEWKSQQHRSVLLWLCSVWQLNRSFTQQNKREMTHTSAYKATLQDQTTVMW